MTQIVRHCPDCGGERAFEQPHRTPGECPDASGALGTSGDCPEWACTACGAALLLGLPVVRSGPARRAEPAPARRVA
jgi:hypothetical protein